MALYLDLKPGDAVHIGGGTVVRVERKSGQATRLRIDSEYKVTMDRGDLRRPEPAAQGTNNEFRLERPKVGQ